MKTEKNKVKKVILQMGIDLKKIDKENFTLDGIFSTEDEDRHGEIVYQNWDLKQFKKNPVILNSHNYQDITEILAKVIDIKVDKETKKLVGSIQFAVAENPKAKIAFDLYAGKYARAFSVGFMPKEFDDKGNILKSELLEISLVSVPANAMALAKSKGIEVDKLYEKSKNDTDTKNDDEKSEEPKDSKDSGKNGGEGDGKSKSDSEDKRKKAEADKLEKEETEKLEKEEKQKKEDKEEKEAEEKALNEFKRTPSNILKSVVQGEVDIKRKSLQRILSAVKLVSKTLKVETRQETDGRAETNRLINKTIRELKKLK